MFTEFSVGKLKQAHVRHKSQIFRGHLDRHTSPTDHKQGLTPVVTSMQVGVRVHIPKSIVNSMCQVPLNFAVCAS